MKQRFSTISVVTKKQFELVDVTDQVRAALKQAGVQSGTVHMFVPHTTAAIRLNHNEPLLMQDIMKALYRLAPLDISYNHDLFEVRVEVSVNERTNGHAHVKAFFLGSSENVPVQDGKLMLGERQSIFFVELDGGRTRQLHVTVSGE